MSVNNDPSPAIQRKVEDLKKAFMLFDQDKNGEVTTEEIGTVLRNLGLFLTESELQQMLRDINLNRDGTFSLNEFVELMDKVGTFDSQTEDEEDKELKAAFKVFNRSGSGYITEIDLRSVLNSLGEYLSNEEIEDMIEEVDLDGDGRIDYNEFVASLKEERKRNSICSILSGDSLFSLSLE